MQARHEERVRLLPWPRKADARGGAGTEEARQADAPLGADERPHDGPETAIEEAPRSADGHVGRVRPCSSPPRRSTSGARTPRSARGPKGARAMRRNPIPSRRTCCFSRWIDLFAKELPWLRGEDLDWVMGRGVCEWLGWPLPTA